MEEQITTINGEMTNVTTRLQSAEIKLQPTNILMAVNEKIGADGKLYTTKFVLDKAGVHISGGGLDISNNAGTKVLYADTEGNLTINKLTAVDGNFTGTITGSVITGGSLTGATITSNSGKIGGWELSSQGLISGTAKFMTENNYFDKNAITNVYTWADLWVMQSIITGTWQAPEEVIKHYDLDGDGAVRSIDYSRLKLALAKMDGYV